MSAQRPVFFDGRDFRRLSSTDFLDPDVLAPGVVRDDGSVGFTSPQAGVAPEDPNDLATAQWVWDAIEDGTWLAPVEDTLNAPPVSPTTGQRWLVGTTPTGDWDGQADNIAVWRGAWVFIGPQHGSVVIVRSINRGLTYTGSEWVSAAAVLEHNGLSGLQGGSSIQRYHLTQAQHDAITGDKPQREVFAAPTGAVGPGGFRALEPGDVSGSTADGQVIVRRGGVPTWDALTAGDVDAVPNTREVTTSDGLSGGGPLSGDLTLTWDGVGVQHGGTLVATRRIVNIIGGAAAVVDADPVVEITLPDPRLISMVFGG